jgi:RHS repeat-associated protein
LHQLVGATNVTTGQTQRFTYGDNGNIISNSQIGDYQYQGPQPHAVTTAGPRSYSYDAMGNMTHRNGQTIAYDGANRPTEVDSSSFGYSADGTRIKKTNKGTSTYYLGDDFEVTGGVTTKYVSLGGVPVARQVGTTKYWVHTDLLRSVQLETDAQGNEVLRRSYRPYGEILSERRGAGPSPSPTPTATTSESRGFAGERTDETGLTYLHARYYDAQLARFVTADPTTSDGTNRYMYALNNPVLFKDTSGFDAVPGEGPLMPLYLPPSQYNLKAFSDPTGQDPNHSWIRPSDQHWLGAPLLEAARIERALSQKIHGWLQAWDMADQLIGALGCAVAGPAVARSQPMQDLLSVAAGSDASQGIRPDLAIPENLRLEPILPGRFNIYRYKNPTSVRETGWVDGDRLMVPGPYIKESAGLIAQDLAVLEEEMRLGNPIGDTFVKPNGEQYEHNGMLLTERLHFDDANWTYDPSSAGYTPPPGLGEPSLGPVGEAMAAQGMSFESPGASSGDSGGGGGD